jgi:hypothetical protein
MKTPMSREIIANWSLPKGPSHNLTVEILLEGQAAAGREVGCIIDLANHDVRMGRVVGRVNLLGWAGELVGMGG